MHKPPWLCIEVAEWWLINGSLGLNFNAKTFRECCLKARISHPVHWIAKFTYDQETYNGDKLLSITIAHPFDFH